MAFYTFFQVYFPTPWTFNVLPLTSLVRKRKTHPKPNREYFVRRVVSLYAKLYGLQMGCIGWAGEPGYTMMCHIVDMSDVGI